VFNVLEITWQAEFPIAGIGEGRDWVESAMSPVGIKPSHLIVSRVGIADAVGLFTLDKIEVTMRILAQAVFCSSTVLCSSVPAQTLEAPSSNTPIVHDVGVLHAIQYSGPIFDVHLHTDPPATVRGVPNPVTGAPAAANALGLRDAVIEECRKYNVTRAVLNGWPGTLEKWAELDPKRFVLAPMILNKWPPVT
jgi:hypothetical protein